MARKLLLYIIRGIQVLLVISGLTLFVSSVCQKAVIKDDQDITVVLATSSLE